MNLYSKGTLTAFPNCTPRLPLSC